MISYYIEPTLPSVYSCNPNPTTFPPMQSLDLLPTNIIYVWTDETFDEDVHDAAQSSAKVLFNAAVSSGQCLQSMLLYPNYAIYGTPLENVYRNNLLKLWSLQLKVDPHNVMVLIGGWKFSNLPFIFHSFYVCHLTPS